MVIYFSASRRNILVDINVYRKIIDAVRAQGSVIARDWVETTWAKESNATPGEDPLSWVDWGIVQDAEGAIEESELLIAEASDISTFGVGYEVGLALQKRKPILILIHKDAADRSYAAGLNNDLITYRKYDIENIYKIVETFIKENTIKKKDLRFNFVIDRQIHNYLRLRSYESGKTKAEVVRDLLLKDMQNDD